MAPTPEHAAQKNPIIEDATMAHVSPFSEPIMDTLHVTACVDVMESDCGVIVEVSVFERAVFKLGRSKLG